MLYLRGFVSVQVNVRDSWKVLGPYLLVCYCVRDLHAFFISNAEMLLSEIY